MDLLVLVLEGGKTLVSQGHFSAFASTLSVFRCLLPFPFLVNLSLFHVLVESVPTHTVESCPRAVLCLQFSIVMHVVTQSTHPDRPGATVDASPWSHTWESHLRAPPGSEVPVAGVGSGAM